MTLAGFILDHANYECDSGNGRDPRYCWYVNVYGHRTDDKTTLRRETVLDGLDERTARRVSLRLNMMLSLIHNTRSPADEDSLTHQPGPRSDAR